MKKSLVRVLLATAVLCTGAIATVRAQQAAPLTTEQKEQRVQTEKELESAAIIERKVMVPMRDGVRLATDIYRPKNASGKVPIIWVRTPYNFNFWDVRNGVPVDMKAALTAVKRGYAYVVQEERGHFFSEGNYDILGAPRTDGYDALAWLSSQSWANGKVGTTGCSSTAEYQMGVAAMGHPAYAAMNVQGFGAGVGRVAPYHEQGNWYRGGAVQMLFITWLYGEQNQVRPMFPPDTSREDLIRASKAFDLAQQLPPVDWSKASGPFQPFKTIHWDTKTPGGREPQSRGIQWLIVGGESKQGDAEPRKFEVQWALDAIAQCKAAGVPCFVKQLGSRPVWPIGDGRGVGAPLRARAGEDPSEWPEALGLNVREFPK